MGALTIRLPESLHDHVRKLARQEGLSMNQFVMLAVAEKVTRLDEGASWTYVEALEAVGQATADKRGETLEEAARSILDQAPDNEPPPEDQRVERSDADTSDVENSGVDTRANA